MDSINGTEPYTESKGMVHGHYSYTEIGKFAIHDCNLFYKQEVFELVDGSLFQKESEYLCKVCHKKYLINTPK